MTMKLTMILSSVALMLALCGVASAQPAEVLDAGAEVAVPVDVEAAPATTPSIEADPIGTVETLVKSIREGNWRLVAALALGLLMLGLAKAREWGPVAKLFSGDRGGAILVAVLALGGALSAALLSSASLDWKLFVGALGVAWTAVGGYTWAKRLIWPKDA